MCKIASRVESGFPSGCSRGQMTTGQEESLARLENCPAESPDLTPLPTLQKTRPRDRISASILAPSPEHRADILNVAAQPAMCRIGIKPWVPEH